MCSELETEFHEEMVSIFHKSGKATGYWPSRFLQKVRKVGGLQAAREWLSFGENLSPGLIRLAKEGRIDLSMEALVIKEPWRQLFTEDEINLAERRLAAASKMVNPIMMNSQNVCGSSKPLKDGSFPPLTEQENRLQGKFGNNISLKADFQNNSELIARPSLMSMRYDEINSNINHILYAINPNHVKDYDWLIQNIHQVTETEYKKKYKTFWRLNGAGLSINYCHAYFQYLQDGLENGVPPLNIIADELYRISVNGNKQALQFSFCTKLCHMLNREIPIYDSRIRIFYHFIEPPRSLPVLERINRYVQFHQFLIKEYNRILNEGLLTSSIQAFRQQFNPNHFTEKKVIDSLIWAFINSEKVA